jgi:hypothetical protein
VRDASVTAIGSILLGTGAMLKNLPLNAHALYYIQPAAFDKENVNTVLCAICTMRSMDINRSTFEKVMLNYS